MPHFYGLNKPEQTFSKNAVGEHEHPSSPPPHLCLCQNWTVATMISTPWTSSNFSTPNKRVILHQFISTTSKGITFRKHTLCHLHIHHQLIMLSPSPLHYTNNAVLWHIMPLHLPSPHAMQLPPPYASTLATHKMKKNILLRVGQWVCWVWATFTVIMIDDLNDIIIPKFWNCSHLNCYIQTNLPLPLLLHIAVQ